MKNLRFLVAIVAMISLLASCSKNDPSRVDIITGHKWAVTSDVTTYSDSPGVSHNNRAYLTTTCQQDGYYEFRNYVNSTTQRNSYFYTETKCLNETDDVTVSNWDMDKEEAFFAFGAGNWYKIVSLDASKVVLSLDRTINYTYYPNVPPYIPVSGTHTVTSSMTFTAK